MMFAALRKFSCTAILSLMGCTILEAAPVTYIVVTPDAPVLAQAATPLPTPSRPPAETMRIAAQAALNGYYEEAFVAYHEILDLPAKHVPPLTRADAAFALGQVGNRAGEYVVARAALSLFIRDYSTDERLPQAHYLRGSAALALGLWKLSIADFQEYLAQGSSLLASYVWERIADARLALNEYAEAIQHYQLALQHPRSLIPQLILREKLARIYWQASEYAQAVTQYDEILAVARNAPYRAEMDYNAALATLESGESAAGIERMRKITLEYPETAHAYLALQTLDQYGIALPDSERAFISYQLGDYASALAALEEETAGKPITPEQYLMMGRSQRGLDDYAAAQLTFQIMAAVYPDSLLLGEALLEQGRTYFQSGNVDAAIERYLSIAADYPQLETAAAEALWRVGYLYGTRDETESSRRIFLQLYEQYPTSEQAESGLSLAATAAVKMGDNEAAAQIYMILTQTTSAELRAEAWLWLGAHPEAADGLDSAFALAQAAASAPDSYFAARAADIAATRAPFSPPTSFQFSFDEGSDRAAAEAWLRERWNLSQLGALWPLSDALRNDVRLLRGQEMWMLGEFDEAQDEFLALVNTNQGDALASYQLAVYLRDAAVYYPSLVAAANVIRLAGLATLEAPAFIARLRYPSYYLQPLLASTRARGIDPLLLLALIRQESLFNAHATAAAGEKGLTQVIPSTGDYIASRLTWPNYAHSDLFRPYASIEFGAYYLAEQLTNFDQHTLAALSGYNAGPGRAAEWLALAGEDIELFISAITINSTRHYVQRIYAQYVIYRELYGGN